MLKPELTFDPEVAFAVDYMADAEGWAHSMQVHPDGSADYIRHRLSQLDSGVRWICRTPDQDALGIILPATAEAEGYSAEKAKGNIKELQAGDCYTVEIGGVRRRRSASNGNAHQPDTGVTGHDGRWRDVFPTQRRPIDHNQLPKQRRKPQWLISAASR